MKNKKQISSTILAMVVIALTTISCRKEGCTDPDARNYNASYKKDDCSCEYTGKVGFYWNFDTYNNLLTDGYTGLIKVHINGTFFMSTSMDNHFNAPVLLSDCPISSQTYPLGRNKTYSGNYQIFGFNDGIDVLIQSGEISWDASKNLFIQLNY
jgi:hypothetical protein